jgi:hypothetical protein
MAEGEPSEEFQLYHYDPSLAAAAISAILFLVTTLVHIWQIFKHKTWFFVAFIVGGLCKKAALSLLVDTRFRHETHANLLLKLRSSVT